MKHPQAFTPTELAALVHALGRAGHLPPEGLLLAAVAHLEARLHAEEAEWCTTNNSGGAGHGHGYGRHARPQRPPETPARALANLMAGFGRLGFYPGDSLAACVRARLLAALPSLNARDVADVVGAWADLAHR